MYYQTVLGMREDEMEGLFRRLHMGVIYHTVFSVCTALILWEYFLNIDAEIRTWRNLLNGQILPARLAVLVVRYSSLLSVLFAAMFLWGETKSCQALFYAHYGAYCLVWASSASIFLMRMQILFMNQRFVCIAYYAIWATCLGAWIFTVTQIRSEPTPDFFELPYVPTCVPRRFPRLGVLAWSASVLFDSSVFLGTYLRYHSTFRHACKTARTTSQAPSRKWSFHANFYYFGTSLIFNVACLVSALAVEDDVLSHIGAIIAMTHMSIIATRLVFSAKGWAKKFGREDDLIKDTAARFQDDRGEAKKSAIRFTVKETIMFDSKCDDDDDQHDHHHHQDEELGRGGKRHDHIAVYDQGRPSSESHQHRPYQSESLELELKAAGVAEKTPASSTHE